MVDGRTRLGEEFSKADTFRFRARAQLNNEIQRSHELTNDEKFNLFIQQPSLMMIISLKPSPLFKMAQILKSE